MVHESSIFNQVTKMPLGRYFLTDSTSATDSGELGLSIDGFFLHRVPGGL